MFRHFDFQTICHIVLGNCSSPARRCLETELKASVLATHFSFLFLEFVAMHCIFDNAKVSSLE